MSTPYKKLKVGRVSGYPVAVTQGKREHEAILIGCDDDPRACLSRALTISGEVEIRWSVAGYNDAVPASSVRLRQQFDGTRIPAARAEDHDERKPEAVVSCAIKTEEKYYNQETDDEGDGKPLAVGSGVAVKTEDTVYEAHTDDEENDIVTTEGNKRLKEAAVTIDDVPIPRMAHVASYLPKTSRAILAAAMAGIGGKKRQPSALTKVVLSLDQWEELDFADIEKEGLAGRLSDDDVAAILLCIDAHSRVKTLKLTSLVKIKGQGLGPIRGSNVIKQIDLSLAKSHRERGWKFP